MDLLITVYGRRGCGACHVTRRHLDQLHVPFEYVDLDAPGGTLRALAEMPAGLRNGTGPTNLPIVTISDAGELVGYWNGYRPASIEALAR